ncbi:hypothetical protein Tco_0709534 [Tanacetum coccineum]
MTTLAEFMIIAGADNRPPMLEKSMYDSWKSCMELYIENRENGRMILNSVQNGPHVWPLIVQEDGTTKTKKYEELLVTEKLQADCELKLPTLFFRVFHRMCIPLSIIIKFPNRYGTELSFLYVKLARDLHTTNYDQLYSYLEQHETHANETHLMRERYQDPLAFLLQGSLQPTINLELPLIQETRPLFKTVGLIYKKFKGGKDKVMLVLAIRVMLLVLKEIMQEGRQGLLNAIIVKVKDTWLGWLKHRNLTEDLDVYDYDCDDVSNAKAVLMTNLSNYDLDVISEVRHSESYHNDLNNQSVHAMQDFEQTPVVDFPDNEIISDSNIILHSQYLQETQ